MTAAVPTTYEFALASHFSDGVNAAKLKLEIMQEDSIYTALNYVDREGELVHVSFKNALDTKERVELDRIINNHDGKPIYNPEQPQNPDGRTKGHNTARPNGTVTHVTGRGDDPTNNLNVGGGVKTFIHHKLNDPMTMVQYSDWNTIANKTYIHEGYVSYFNWKPGDGLDMIVVPKVTSYSAGVETNFALYNGYLIVPAPGVGNINVQPENMVLVEVSLTEENQRAGAGFWDATFNESTGQFDNIRPNVTGTGIFNMFAVEVPLAKFVLDINLLTGINQAHTLELDTTDADYIGHGLRIKYILNIATPDHEMSMGANVTMYRQKTV